MRKFVFLTMLSIIINSSFAIRFYELKANDIKEYELPGVDIFSNAGPAESLNLLSFEAVYEESKISVYWSAPSEQNIDHYILERSDNGQNFEILTTVKSAGNSSKSTKYSVVDNNPPAKVLIYYRLMQTSIDGSGKYSEIYTARSNNYYSQLMITPPAFNGRNIETKVKNLKGSTVLVEVSNILGATYYSQAFETTPNFTKLDIEVPYLKKGDIYFLKISNGQEIITKKFTF
ncbi:MAG: T9SS type A sorting domain-containing protein [Bacteroidales bacterium]|nr:T9SS type A sorting domain-containing protein [Bacteroidales bacterium]